MARRCSRPGCCEVAVAACGMDPSTLVCWIAPLVPDRGDALGVLCDAHAERLRAPQGWQLDDRRHAELQLFRPPPTDAAVRPIRVVIGRATEPDPTEQLALPDLDDEGAILWDDPVDPTPSWPPVGGFDPGDSILPDVTGPLMARAFRGIDGRRAD